MRIRFSEKAGRRVDVRCAKVVILDSFSLAVLPVRILDEE